MINFSQLIYFANEFEDLSGMEDFSREYINYQSEPCNNFLRLIIKENMTKYLLPQKAPGPHIEFNFQDTTNFHHMNCSATWKKAEQLCNLRNYRNSGHLDGSVG